jgi:lipoyl synthase
MSVAAFTELIQIEPARKTPAPKPEWLKARAPVGEPYHDLKKLARSLNLHTVCE